MIERGVLKLNDSEREALKAEFDNLETINRKYNFWQEKFNYSYAHRGNLYYESVLDFFIDIKTTDEIEILNKIVYAECEKNIQEDENSDLANTKSKFLDSLDKYSQKGEIINGELKKIEAKISIKPVNESEDYFILGYKNYLIYHEELDWQNKIYHYSWISAYINGREWAKYKEFVQAHLNQKKSKDEFRFSHEVQIMILDYLGFNRNLGNNKEKSKYYAPLLNRTIETTRQKFSSIEEYRTKENLKKILVYLEHLGFNAQANQVKKDLEKLS